MHSICTKIDIFFHQHLINIQTTQQGRFVLRFMGYKRLMGAGGAKTRVFSKTRKIFPVHKRKEKNPIDERKIDKNSFLRYL